MPAWLYDARMLVADAVTPWLLRLVAVLNPYKDEALAERLHDLAGRYQKRPQAGWEAPPDWGCWEEE